MFGEIHCSTYHTTPAHYQFSWFRLYGDVHLLYLSIRKFNVKTPNGGGAGIIKLKKELIHLAFINLNIFVYFDMRGWVRERERIFYVLV